MRPLRATYRLQLGHAFPFARAREVVPYLRRLGVSHLYSSPVLTARPGSEHGYDVVDPTRANPDLGGEAELASLCRALRRTGLGLVLDIVPNHMAASPENPFWDDVLAHGRASRFAGWFDVDWEAGRGRTRGRVLLPVLGGPLAGELAAGRLALAREGTRLRVRYFDRSFPLDPATIPLALALARSDGRHGRGASALERHGSRLEAALAALRALPQREEGPAVAARRHAAAERALGALEGLLARSPATRAEMDAALAAFRGPGSEGRLRRLLAAQAYALVHWRRARAEVNYRRFFDINDLVGLRTEDEAVFAATHARILDWTADGRLDGLRIDHVDGLRDPLAYLRRLRGAVEERLGQAAIEWPILVEKILSPRERLPAGWPVAGTTGYDFLNQVEAVLLDPGGVAEIEAAYRVLAGRAHGFEEAARRGKRRVLAQLLATDVERVALRLRRCARRDPAAAALRLSELASAIAETVVHLPVYRTYVDGRPASPRPADRRRIDSALAGARAAGRAPSVALDLVERLLLQPPAARRDPEAEHHRLAFVERFQQLSGPAAAKGVEDTALYVHVPLVSRNEVGGAPGPPPVTAVRALHAANLARARRWPRALLAVTTHDTKRSADVRARLDVLSELPREWLEHVGRWRRWNRALRRRVGSRWLPDSNTEYLLYQTLVGIWPLPGRREDWSSRPSEAALADLGERLRAYVRKAAREAKEHTSWIDPDETFEAALDEFAGRLLSLSGARRFLDDLARFARHVSRPGLWNALARTLVQLTAPGVPDLYQGDELWAFALVDPDNRRPVDFEHRARLVANVERGFEGGEGRLRRAFLRDVVAAPQDGRLKLHVIRRALRARVEGADLFPSGSYRPLSAEGSRAAHVFAFSRTAGRRAAVTIVPRLTMALGGDSAAPLGEAAWGETALRLPPGLAGMRWVDALTGERPAVERTRRRGSLRLARAFSRLPVALLVGSRRPSLSPRS